MAFSEKRIKLFSGSQFVLGTLAGQEFTSRLAADRVEPLNSLTINNLCTLEWVPGLSRVCDAEKADLHANQGSVLESVGLKPSVPVCAFSKKIQNAHRV